MLRVKKTGMVDRLEAKLLQLPVFFRFPSKIVCLRSSSFLDASKFNVLILEIFRSRSVFITINVHCDIYAQNKNNSLRSTFSKYFPMFPNFSRVATSKNILLISFNIVKFFQI